MCATMIGTLDPQLYTTPNSPNTWPNHVCRCRPLGQIGQSWPNGPNRQRLAACRPRFGGLRLNLGPKLFGFRSNLAELKRNLADLQPIGNVPPRTRPQAFGRIVRNMAPLHNAPLLHNSTKTSRHLRPVRKYLKQCFGGYLWVSGNFGIWSGSLLRDQRGGEHISSMLSILRRCLRSLSGSTFRANHWTSTMLEALSACGPPQPSVGRFRAGRADAPSIPEAGSCHALRACAPLGNQGPCFRPPFPAARREDPPQSWPPYMPKSPR